MFLYEATSTLIVFGSLKVELKEQYMKELAGSLLQKFLAANEELCKVTNSEDQQKILCYMSNIIGYSSYVCFHSFSCLYPFLIKGLSGK